MSRHEKEGLFLENPGLDGILTVSYERRMTEKIFMVSTISTEKQQLRFTKNNTLAIKGIAIIFLLCYHCFSDKGRLHGAAVSFWPLSEGTAIWISKNLVICVGMFAFLSAYGLTLSLKNSYKDYSFSGHEAAMFVLKRYVKLVFTFMLPFFLCAGLTFVTGTASYRYKGGLWENLISVVMDFFGVGHLFGTQMMINTWWFLSLEILIIVLMPFMVRFYKKYSWLMVIMFLVLGSFMLQKHVHLTKYFFVVPIAVCFADQRVLERLKEFSPVKNQLAGKMLKLAVSMLMILIMFRMYGSQWGIQHFEFVLNGLLPVVIIYWAYEFVIELPVIRQILEFLGKHSADIFYTHTFVRSLWIPGIVYSFRHAAVIFLFLLGVSLGISFFLDFLRKLLHYNKFTGGLTDRFMLWADSALK